MPTHSFRLRRTRALVALALASATAAVHAADWIVSSNDGKYQRVEGRDTYLPSPPADTLTLLDASTFPPKVAQTVDVENGIQGRRRPSRSRPTRSSRSSARRRATTRPRSSSCTTRSCRS